MFENKLEDEILNSILKRNIERQKVFILITNCKSKYSFYIDALQKAINKIKIEYSSQSERADMILNDHESKLYNDELMMEEIIEMNSKVQVFSYDTAVRKINLLEKIKDNQKRRLLEMKKKVNNLEYKSKLLKEKELQNQEIIKSMTESISKFSNFLYQIINLNNIFIDSKMERAKLLLKSNEYYKFLEEYEVEKILNSVKF